MYQMSKIVDWVELTNREIIELILKSLETNKDATTIYRTVKQMELTPQQIQSMVASDISDVITKWNKYYNYGYIPFNEYNYAETSNLMYSRTSMVSTQLASTASNSFANLTAQMFNMTLDGSISRNQAISILKKKYTGNTIMYANGTPMPIDSYLHMVFRTELGNVTRERAREVGDDLGTTVYQMSFFADSAERCINAQGGYINFGQGDQTVEFKNSYGRLESYHVRDVVLHDGYGQPDKLGGIGCRHTWVPRIPGFSRSKTIVQNTDFFTGL